MEFKSTNPYNGEVLATYKGHTDEEINTILDNADKAFAIWRETEFEEREELMYRVADVLRDNIDKYAETISLEVGKPIKEARAEVEKCAWVCDFYAQNAERFLADALIETDAEESFISYDPLGCILAIMPWNYPFWQVFRYAAPTIMAGNVAVLKHATNVLGAASHMEELFIEAGFPPHIFQNLFIHHDKVGDVITHDTVKAVTLTGSEKAGSSVAEIAGKHIKKTVLELGGNNAFIVLKDADLDKAVKIGVNARMQNTGQSCIAAKRFIVEEAVYDKFLEKYVAAVKELKSGNPLDENTQIGVVSSEKAAEQLEKQLQASVQAGATIALGGKRDKAYFEPTVLTGVKPGMPAFDEETFGPLAAVIKVKDEEEAYTLAAQSRYGLGLAVFTQDIDKVFDNISRVPDGALFVNDLVKSDPRLPFGGTKKSGYGRELSKEGILEFVNIKTVYIKK